MILLVRCSLFTTFLISETHILFLAWTERLEYNCSICIVRLEGNCDGSIYAYAIRSGS
jgi:hypothetical protein